MVVAQLLLLAALQQPPAIAPAAETIVVTPAAAVELEVDGTRTFEAKVRDADGRPIDDAEIRWIVPEADVAAIKGAIFTSDLNSGLWIARLRQGALVP